MDRFGGSLSCVLLVCSLTLFLFVAPGSGGAWAVDHDGSADAAVRDPTSVGPLAPDGVAAFSSVSNGSLAGRSGQPTPDGIRQEDQPAADNTITRIELAENGSATWTLRIRTRLDTDADADDYRAFQDSFRENTSRYLGTFERRMTGVVSNADASFDREMRATGFEARTSIQELPQRWGVVTYEFTWRGFAATDDDRLLVGDVFAGGFFIDDDDVLEVVVPPAYAVDAVDPEPSESSANAVEWQGREDFPDMRPRIVAVPVSEGSSAAGGTGVPLLPVLGGLLVVLAAVAVGVAHRRAPAGVAGPVAKLFGSGPDTRDGKPTTPASGAGETGADEPGDAVAEDLLTDEDRVDVLLAEHGGRMKQGDIVEELGWSKSKGSRVLSTMAEDGRIRKLRIGRENLIERQDDGADDAADGGDQSDEPT